jgi:hypothetical protein
MRNLLRYSFLFFAVTACESQKPAAIGGDNEIVVFADSANWSVMEETVRSVFERTFRTPQIESEFHVKRIPLSVFRSYKLHKFILFIGTLEGTDDVSENVRNMLGESAVAAVWAGTHYLFTRDDEWSRGQKLMILTSNDITDLRQKVLTDAEKIFTVADAHKTRLVSEFMYRTAAPIEDKALQNDLFRKYGWFLRIHPDFKLMEQNEDSNYVRFHSLSHHSSLQKWISVNWMDSASDSQLTTEWLKACRVRLGRWFIDPVVPIDDFDRFYVGDVNGRRALVYRGLWKTVSLQNAFGGAFRTYGFYEPEQKRLYVIDQAVFFPEQSNKLVYLREMDVITQTFSVVNPNLDAAP